MSKDIIKFEKPTKISPKLRAKSKQVTTTMQMHLDAKEYALKRQERYALTNPY